jgi:eukaryotic-like serine/threonine-protein kinase
MSEHFEPLQFGRYTLLERLAIGGMAEIFKAKTHGAHGFEKTLVVKRILPHLAADAEFIDMFIDEAKMMVQLNHPKVVQVLDFGEVDGQYYIAMEYIQGIDGLELLRCCARHRCRPTTGIAVHIVADVLDALDYAHNLRDAQGRPLNIVHRDISPSNIFVSDLGEVKLGDFGIARAEIRRRHTETGALKGKYGYMSPEAVSSGAVDHRADIFAVGIMLAELLMIRRLFIAKSELEVLLQVRDARLDRLDKYGRHIQAELRMILGSALARDPNMRYQDAASFRDALHRYLFEQQRLVRSTEVRLFLQRLRTLDAEAEKTPHARLPRLRHTDSEAEVRELGAGEEDLVSPAPVPVEEPLVEEPPVEEPPVEAPPEAAPPEAAGMPDLEILAQAMRRAEQEGTEYSAHTRERIVVGKSSPALDDDWPVGVDEVEPLSSSEEAAWQAETASIGRKRKILLAPPPRSQPVPTGLAETGEQPRLNTAEGLQAMGELGTSGSSSRDFHSSGSDEVVKPAPEEVVTPMEASMVAASRVSLPLSDATPDEPYLKGDLSQQSLFKVLFRLAVAEETGLVVLQTSNTVKEIFLADGDPQYVTSNMPEELFGQYLLQRGVIAQGELSMALAMLPHFDGKLGNALVALKLLRPVQVLRHLTHQVRQKLLNAFAVEDGSYAYHRGRTCEQESAPLGLDAFEVIGAGVMALPEPVLTRRIQPLLGQRLRSISPPPIPAEAFRLGARPRQIFDELDGRLPLSDLLHRYDDLDQRASFARIVYLLVETSMATAV